LAWRVLKHFPSTLPALHDMEFVQFHPTAFYHDGRVHFLISEAVRGEGAYLVNANGQRFMPTVHPDAELAPRDVVTRAIFAEMSHAQAPCVYLDVRHFPAGLMQKRFPSIYQWLRRLHLETARDLIPVTPAAHYLMGGIPVNLRGESTAKGLYAVGEVAATGLHGANRLASNSLLECVVLARRVAETIAIRQATAEAAGVSWTLPEPLNLTPVPYQMLPPGHALLRTLEENTKALAQLMWEQVGIIRQTSRLRDALKTLHRWEAQAQEGQWRWIVPQGLEYVDRLLLARLTAQAAWNRKQSVGAHYRLSDKIAEREPRPVSGGGVSSSVATPGGSPRPGARLALVTTAAASGSPNPHGSPL
jgi:L-aspartate oxidase